MEKTGLIQWKGTDVCMDIYCKCGQHSHIDGFFASRVRCPACGTVYKCSNEIQLTEDVIKTGNFITGKTD